MSDLKSSLRNLFITLVLGIPNTLMGAFVLSKMWGWFIAPKFGVVPLGLLDSVGVMFVAGAILGPWFFYAKTNEKDDGESNVMKLLITMLFIHPFGLLFGFLWHQFQ